MHIAVHGLIAPTMKLCVNKGIRLQKMGNEIGIQTKNWLSKSMLLEKHSQFENYICLVKGKEKRKKVVVKSWHGKLN